MYRFGMLNEYGHVRPSWLHVHEGAHCTLAKPFAADADRYRRMRAEFDAIAAARPYLNQCIIACTVGAQAFAVTVTDLQTRPNRDIMVTRQKIMAFTKVVTDANYHQVARAFNIDHSAVIRACERFEDFIRLTLAGKIGCD
jgi:hypothetical protein